MTGEQYLKEHGISPETIDKFKLSWDENELHIPVLDERGKAVFAKHRNLKYDPENPESQKYRYDSGAHATLFNYPAVKEKSYMVISEGEVDCMKLNQEGVPSASSTGGSKTFMKEWAELLEGKTIFIAYDNDSAGRSGTIKLLELMPEARAVIWPEGIKDVCDYFYHGHDKKQFIDLLKSAMTKTEWEQHYLPEEFSLISAEELSQKKFTEEPWIMEKIIYSEGFCFIYGSEGTGKSFITLSIADAVARGEPWLGQFKVPKAAKVLFIDKENPESMTAKRLLGLSITSPNIFWLKYPEKLQLVDSRGEMSQFANSLSSIVSAEDISLIIIDSFVDLMVGTENKAEDTQAFFDAVRNLFPQKAILVLHHENKPIQGAYRTDSQRMRGSSNINAQTNTQFRLEVVAKSKTEMTLKQTKARDAQRLDKFMIRMKVETLPDTTTKVTGFEYVGIVAGEDQTKKEEVQEIINNILADVPAASRQELLTAATNAGISERTFITTIQRMAEDGMIEEIKKGREKYYAAITMGQTAKNNENDE